MKWSASNYREKITERRRSTKPRWVTLPSGIQFYLRPVSAVMSSLLAGCLPSTLTEAAARAWKEEGVAGFDDVKAKLAREMTPEQVADSLRRTQKLSAIIQEASVIPLLANEISTVQFTDEWKAEAVEGLKELDGEFDVNTFKPAELVLDPRDLANEDSEWLFQWAAGMVADVELKGGGAVTMANLKSVPKPLARGSITELDEQKLRLAS